MQQESASCDELVLKKRTVSIISNKVWSFAKSALNLFPLKEVTTNVSHHFRQKHTVEYYHAMVEQMLVAGDAQPKCKQITSLSITGTLDSCTPYDRKSKWCLWQKSRQDFKQLVKRLDPDESQVENIFQFYMVQYRVTRLSCFTYC